MKGLCDSIARSFEVDQEISLWLWHTFENLQIKLHTMHEFLCSINLNYFTFWLEINYTLHKKDDAINNAFNQCINEQLTFTKLFVAYFPPKVQTPFGIVTPRV